MYNRLQFVFLSIKRRKSTIIAAVLLFVGLVLFFPAGSFSNSARLENASYQLAQIAKEKTNNKTYTSFIVEPIDETSQMNNTFGEFIETRGKFRGNYSRFAGTINANKDHSILWKDGPDVNFSFLYVASPGFNNKYTNDKWAHEYYPINLMFKGEHKTANGALSFLYISESYAKFYLESIGKEATTENYYSLLGKTNITLDFDSVPYNYTIADIMLEDSDYYKDLHSVIGDFFLSSNKYPPGFKKQSLYFLTENVFQNQYYLEYATTLYNHFKYQYSVGEYNLISGEIIDSESIINGIVAKSNEIASTSLYVLAFVCVGCFLFVFFYSKIFKLLSDIFIIGISSIFPYLIFKFIFVLSENVLLFSYSSLSFYIFTVFILSILIITVILLSFLKLERKYEKNN